MQIASKADKQLFKTNHNATVRLGDFLSALEKIQANDCDYLFVHTAISFGFPLVSKKELLEELLEAIISTGVPNIIFPTFTFSFCNGESFNAQTTKTKMGALNEFARNDFRFERSQDPLLSVCMYSNDMDIVRNIGKCSIGEGSSYDLLDQKKNVNFMFLGTGLGDCFTYMHYLEAVANVPYRYHKKFPGIINAGGREFEDEYSLFVRYNGVLPNSASYSYEASLLDQGALRKVSLGENNISIVSKDQARDLYLDLIQRDVFHFVEGDVHSKDESFNVVNMQAL